MNDYRQGEYDSALKEARRFNTPAFFWDPIIRAAGLGQLGRQPEADKAVAELLALVTDFERRGRSLIQRVAFSEENTEMLLEGLSKAGLELAAKSTASQPQKRLSRGKLIHLPTSNTTQL